MLHGLYYASILALAAALLQTGRLAYALCLPRVLTLCVSGGLLIYLAGLIPGAAGHFTAGAAGTTLILLSAITFLATMRLRQRAGALAPADARSFDSAGPWLWRGPWNPATTLACVAALLGVWPLLQYARHTPGFMRYTFIKLNFDTVSYHLPALVDYAQNHSLWYLEGPFSSYSYAFELIYGYPMLFWHTYWTLVPAGVYCTLFVVSAITLVSVRAAHSFNVTRNPAGWGGEINALLVALVAVGLYSPRFTEFALNALGKNDLFLGGCLIGALGLFIEWAGPVVHRADAEHREEWLSLRRRVLFVLATASLGLAVGTKPTSLPYVLLFMVLAGAVALARTPGTTGTRVGVAMVTAFAVAIGAGLLGGFWYVRNLIKLHHLFDPGNERGFRMSLLHNWRDPRVYTWHRDSAYFVVALCSILLLAALVVVRRRRQTVGKWTIDPPVMLLAFLASAAVVFVITPFVLFRERTSFIRLGIPLFATAAIALALVAGEILALAWNPRIEYRERWGHHFTNLAGKARPLMPGRAFPCWTIGVALAVLGAAGAILLPIYWSRHPPIGMPSYEVIRGRPQTKIYRWVRALPGQHRIYSVGVRPWGMYGNNWQNRVFYDLHSHALSGKKPHHTHEDPLFYDSWQDIVQRGVPTGPARLLAVLQQFHPDLLVVSIEPEDDVDPNEKPIIDWLRQQPWLTEVYGKGDTDPTASAFEVHDGWLPLVEQYPGATKLVTPAW